MISPLPPAFIFIIGGLLIPLFRGRIKCAYMLALPVLAYFDLLAIGADRAGPDVAIRSRWPADNMAVKARDLGSVHTPLNHQLSRASHGR